MDLFSMPVTLVVKAPNQRIGDQTVECALNWTIKMLKQHLSDAYPSKPKEHQQRLIYSGKLLQDHHTLKEVLRHAYDESQTIHTVHLVCSMTMSDLPSKMKLAEQPAVALDVERSTSAPANSEGLRQRPVNAEEKISGTTNPTAHMPISAPYYGNVMSQSYYSGIPSTSMYTGMPGMHYSPEQIMWYQQMYAQQMAQYMQYMPHSYPVTTAVTSLPAPNNNVGQNGLNEPHVQPQQNNNQQQMVMNAAGGQAMFDDEGEDVNRDWLDWSYILCRFVMLVAIVYFYSTLGRFFMVLGFFSLIYMYQAGWFRLNRRVQALEQQPPPDQPQPQEQQAYDEDHPEESDTERSENIQENLPPPPPGHLRVALSFFMTFFSSLIPQQPGAINAN